MKKFFSISILFAEVLIWTIAILVICVTSSTPIVFATFAIAATIYTLLEEGYNELKQVK